MGRRERGGAARPSYVVIGTSAGGGAALTKIFKDLPEDFPGAILIVIHVAEGGEMDWLVERLQRTGHMPVKLAEEGELILQGTAYIAPSGSHLMVREGEVMLGMGPREQHVRPAIDVLFRSATSAFGSRVIGVVLTGMLRDGSLGLRAVRDAGGITIVQDPSEAEQGDMPRNAMQGLDVDYCLNLAEIGPVLDLLVRRAGSHKEGALETGLATAVRLMKDRVRLLAKLHGQSRRDSRTERFLQDEILALEKDISRIRRLIPSDLARPARGIKKGNKPRPVSGRSR